jgi:hypothetical protein
MIKAFLEAASGISTMWSLAAFTVAAVLYLAVGRRKGKSNAGVQVTSVALLVFAAIPIVGSLLADVYKTRPSIYELRVTVVDAQNTPVEDAKVWSSFGGEPKRVAGGWQFDIPAASVPADHKLTVYASREAAFLKGQSEVTLGSDFHPNTTIQLTHPETAIRGMVTDEKGHAVEGATVTVVGYGKEAVVTKADGGFELPAHAADGQQVELHAETQGLAAGGGWYPAGNAPAEIVLKGEIAPKRQGAGQSRKRPTATGAVVSPPHGDR